MNKERFISKEVEVSADVKRVWNDWSTAEGLKTFFPMDVKLDFKVGGSFEMLFMMNSSEGTQGSEGCTILAIEPQKMLSFTWNAPPLMPNVRKQFTSVVVRFEDKEKSTLVRIFHSGWGDSEEWTQTYNYFDAAWTRVLESLVAKYR